MATLTDIVKGLWSFLVGSIRFILFFGCLITLLIDGFLLVIALQSSDVTQSPIKSSHSNARTYLIPVCIALLSAFGIYATFYKHKASLKWFAVLTGVICVILFMDALNYPSEAAEVKSSTFDNLSKGMENYDWFHLDRNASTVTATAQWDNMQLLFCCGVDGPDDWDKYRPFLVSNKKYPSSCCLPQKGEFPRRDLCTKSDKFYSVGCKERLDQLLCLGNTLSLLTLIVQLVLFLMATVVGFDVVFCQPKPVPMINVEYGQPEYNRFDIQPAMNPTYQQQSEYKSSPPAYGR